MRKIDYSLGVSPIYATPTKTDTAPPLGLEGFSAIREVVKLPLFGIDGLSRDNSAAVIENGDDGVAVVSAIVTADDPAAAASSIKQVIDKARKT